MDAASANEDFVSAALPERLNWADRPSGEHFQSLPNSPAVLLFADERHRPVQLLSTQQLRRFVSNRLTTAGGEARGRADLGAVVRGVRWRRVHCPFEGRWWYYRLARVLHPREYRKMMGFGPCWCLQVDWAQRVPELRVSERVWNGTGEWLGPWPTRKSAQETLEGLWDLFELCRYPEQVRQAPRGTRCAYAEMGRCDAPCDGSTPLTAYADRCRAAWAFAAGGGQRWLADAERRMQSAAIEQAYEQAAQIKQQIEWAQRWQRRWWDQVQPMERFNHMLGLRVSRRKAWKLVLSRQGTLVDGPVIQQRKLTREAPVWLERELNTGMPATPVDVRMEQTWLVAHLLLHREGESSIVVPLRDLCMPQGLSADLEEQLASLRLETKVEPGADTVDG